jgi:hypothetical protein
LRAVGRWWRGLAVLLGLSSCAPGKPRPTPFWTWFAEHAAEVATIRRGDEPIADELASRLRAVHPDLTFELSTKGEPREFIVSAGGLRAAFHAVRKLVSEAPKVPGWRFFAFRQRKEVGEVVMGGARLNGDDVKFKLRSDAARSPLDVDFFVPTAPGQQPKELAGLLYLVLDAALGEHDVEMKIGGMELSSASSAPPDARPLSELAPRWTRPSPRSRCTNRASRSARSPRARPLAVPPPARCCAPADSTGTACRRPR